jgi:hypothetical protein
MSAARQGPTRMQATNRKAADIAFTTEADDMMCALWIDDHRI